MANATPPDSWFERPDPSPEAVLEEAEWEADMFVAEWADLHEQELFIDVSLNRGNEPVFTLTLVQLDGIELASPGEEFESITDLRQWVEACWPLTKEEEE